MIYGIQKIDFALDLIDTVHYVGTPEVGGLTPPQVLEILRGCKGLNIVGGDLVEVRIIHNF